ncbi:SdpI family protein [Candidatus Micrarchaeota archaeon]|nr:SdpI family protein [Candidatus Micrarchaeota archaeon]
MRPANFIIMAIILISVAISIYLYPQMPEQMVSHWNSEGQPDSSLPKNIALFIMPVLSIFLFALFLVIPSLDPLKENIEQFRKYFDSFIVLFMLFFFYVHIITNLWNLGIFFDMGQFLSPALGVLFFYSGILIENSKRNWFIGIKTPWTLSNEKVWNKTHRLGGKLFKISGIFAFFGLLFPKDAMLLILVPILFAVLFSIIYSYLAYQKEMKKSKKK